LGQAKALNLANKTAINEKALLESIAKTSKGILISFAGQPRKLAEAAYEAKKVGLNLEEVKGIQDSLLNVESSIAAEFEAEVLTGKQLNLERARYYALTNNIAGLAKELGAQGITQAKFGNMNVIQQEAVAKAMGMSRDQMAGMLMEQAAISKLSSLEGKTAKEKYDNAVKKYGIEKANAMLGDETLAQQMQSASIQDRFNASIEKLKEVFVTLAEPLMPIFSGFANLVTWITQSKVALGALLGVATALVAIQTTLAIKSLVTAFASIFSGSFMAGPFGLPIAIAGAAALGALIGGVTSLVGDVNSPADGKTQVSTKEGGLFELSKNDDFVAFPGASKLASKPTQIVTPSPSRQFSSEVNYEKIAAAAGTAAAKAIAEKPIEAKTYFDMNEHGRRYQQSTAGQTTRKL